MANETSLEKIIAKDKKCHMIPFVYEPNIRVEYQNNLIKLKRLKIYDKKIYDNERYMEMKYSNNTWHDITKLYELLKCDFEMLIFVIEALKIENNTLQQFWLAKHPWANKQFRREIVTSLFKFFQTSVAKTYKMDTYLINNQSHPTKPTQQIIERALRDFKIFQVKTALKRIDDYISRNNDEPYTEMLFQQTQIAVTYFICKQILREAFMTRIFDRDNIPIIKTIDNFDDFAVKTLLLSSDLLRKFWTNILEISLPDDQPQATQG